MHVCECVCVCVCICVCVCAWRLVAMAVHLVGAIPHAKGQCGADSTCGVAINPQHRTDPHARSNKRLLQAKNKRGTTALDYATNEGYTAAFGEVRVGSRSTSPRWGSIRFWSAPRTCAPRGTRVVSLTKSRKIQ